MTDDGRPPELPPGLLEAYLAGMRVELGVLSGIAERLVVAGDDRDALEELGREAHKIHGSAGSYGFHKASRLAAGVEATAKDWLTRPDEGEVDRGSLIRWFVKRLAQLLGIPEAVAAAPPSPASPAAPAARAPASGAPVPRVGPPPRPRQPPAADPARAVLLRGPSGVPREVSNPAVARVAPPAVARPDADSQPGLSEGQEPRRVEPAPAPPAGGPEPASSAASALGAAAPLAPTGSAAPPAPPPSRPAPSTTGAPAAEPSPGEAPDPAPAPAGVSAAVPEVILVEDDASLAELLTYGLEVRGYRFQTYRNGRDALRELLALEVRGTHPLVLLDVDLPGLDGYSIFDAVERARPGVFRVVFTTVHGTEDEQLRGLEGGALDYLVKPISLRVALEKICRWVGR